MHVLRRAVHSERRDPPANGPGPARPGGGLGSFGSVRGSRRWATSSIPRPGRTAARSAAEPARRAGTGRAVGLTGPVMSPNLGAVPRWGELAHGHRHTARKRLVQLRPDLDDGQAVKTATDDLAHIVLGRSNTAPDHPVRAAAGARLRPSRLGSCCAGPSAWTPPSMVPLPHPVAQRRRRDSWRARRHGHRRVPPP